MRLDLGGDPCARRMQMKATGMVEWIRIFVWSAPYRAGRRCNRLRLLTVGLRGNPRELAEPTGVSDSSVLSFLAISTPPGPGYRF